MPTDRLNHISPSGSKYFHVIALAVLTFAVFYINNAFLSGYLESYESLASEIWSTADGLKSWESGNHPPYKYRVLFRTVVKTAHHLFFEQNNDAFFYTYAAFSFIFLLASVIAFYFLLIALCFSKKLAFAGSVLYMLSPAICMAYTLPVHLKEDTLAFFLLSMGLIAILKRWTLFFVIVSVLGAFCRESLLILPFIFLFFSKENIYICIFASLLPVVVWLSLLFLLDYSAYGALHLGFEYNYENPLQSLFFLFITFSVLWVPFFYNLAIRFLKVNDNPFEGLSIMQRSLPWAFTLVFFTTLFGGRFNEIRIMFLLFPWFIPVGLCFYIAMKDSLRYFFSSPAYILYVVILSSILFYLAFKYLINNTLILGNDYGFGTQVFNQWIAYFIGTVILYIAFLPPALQYIYSKLKK